MPIVCGTDFSEAARAAEHAAAALAARQGTELYLVHALEATAGLLDPAGLQTIEATARQRLEERARELGQRSRGPVRSVVVTGAANEALLRHAAGQQAELLVVGSQGVGATPLYRIGGTAERIAQAASLPVLAVRDAAPFEAWAGGQRPLKIMLGLDATQSSYPPVQWVAWLRQAGPCEVLVGHVYYPVDASARYGLSWAGSLVSRDPELEALLLRDLKKTVGTLPGQGEVRFEVVLGVGRAGDHVLELAERQGADLMVLGTHHKRGLRRLTSVSSVALHYGHASLASIPAGPGLPLGPHVLPRLKRVLVATDLSELSAHAVAYGYAMLAGRGGEVHLVHVVQDERQRPARNSEVVSALRSLVPSGRAAEGIVTRTEALWGEDVARTLCEAAERMGADAICIASRGRTGWKQLLGSVADAVVKQSHQPVMVIKCPAP